jgi:hypothetical protein
VPIFIGHGAPHTSASRALYFSFAAFKHAFRSQAETVANIPEFIRTFRVGFWSITSILGLVEGPSLITQIF